MDSWNDKIVGKDIVIKDTVIQNTEVVDMENDSHDQFVSIQTVYLSNITELEEVHKWKFKLIKVMENKNACIDIGIIEYSEDLNMTDSYFSMCHEHQSYAFSALDGILLDEDGSGSIWRDSPYGQKPEAKEGDVVEMILNSKNMTLRYIVNDNDYGVAFNVVEEKYVAVVTISASTEIELVDSNY